MAQAQTKQRKPFGQIAIQMGLATPAQVREALRIQRKEDDLLGRHRLLGIILIEQGSIASGDLIKILRYYQVQKREKLLAAIRRAHAPELGESRQPL